MAHILVVDDEPDLRCMVRLLVEDIGHEATEACNGREALDVLESGAAIDLVLSDLNMPIMHGLDLREEVGRRWPDLAFILWSVAVVRTIDGRPVEHLLPKDLFSLNLDHLLGDARAEGVLR